MTCIVAQFVRHSLVKVDKKLFVSEAAEMMERQHMGSVIVTRGAEMVGIFTESDMINRIISKGLDPNATVVGDVCSHQLLTISSDRSCQDALLKMRTNGCRRLLVYEGIRFLGMVKMHDLATAIALEEKRKNFLPNLLVGLMLILVLVVIGSVIFRFPEMVSLFGRSAH